jgi:HEAT repeat protein
MSDLEGRPSSELLADALALTRSDPESKTRQEIIWELHRRASPDIFAAARELSDGSDAAARCLAADILAQLGQLEYQGNEQLRPFTQASIPILRQLLRDDDDRVVAAAIAAIGDHYQDTVIAEVPTLAYHRSFHVRLSAAQELRPGDIGAENQVAIDMLIRLSEDEDEAVRDWATFSLGSMGNADTPEIREALYRRLNDRDFDARSEALLGLAARKDERVVPFIASALAADTVGALAVEAAGTIGSPDLLPALLELRSWWDVDTELLETAIQSCSGAER